MSKIMTGSIDVSKINKDKIIVGEKGKYLNIVVFETPDSEYNDYMIVESVTKEEREAGTRGTILGNLKVMVKEDRQLTEAEKDDLPF